MNKSYQITTMQLGPMDNFVYIITDINTKQAAVIDPAWDGSSINQYAKDNQLNLNKILLTHSHHDHINAIEDVLENYDSELHLLKAEADFWQSDIDRPTLHYGGDSISIGDTEIQILHTPGHTPGSACYLLDGDIITGDTLFVYGCGRCDLNGGDPEQMYSTLSKMKKELDADTIIHPGHNYADKKTSSLAEQVEGNPFLHFHDCSEFTNYRMHTHDKTRTTPYHPILAKDLLRK